MTAAPKVIWPIAAPLDIIDDIFMPPGDILDFKVNAMVTTTSNAVVAATDLWKYSIIKS
jgi:hypothetical protein